MRTASEMYAGSATGSRWPASTTPELRSALIRFELNPVAPSGGRDRVAFERALLPVLPTLRAAALRLAKNRADADDLLQETLLRAWRFRPRYIERENCRAWLQRILTNSFCSEYRRVSRRRERLHEFEIGLQLEAAETPTSVASAPTPSDELDERVSAGLLALKPDQRRILSLIDIHERSYREAASELACPIGTVMSRLHRARAALRRQLQEPAARA
jgi:RNA polymerase sigma-70 factor, ECF subfamily